MNQEVISPPDQSPKARDGLKPWQMLQQLFITVARAGRPRRLKGPERGGSVCIAAGDPRQQARSVAPWGSLDWPAMEQRAGAMIAMRNDPFDGSAAHRNSDPEQPFHHTDGCVMGIYHAAFYTFRGPADGPADTAAIIDECVVVRGFRIGSPKRGHARTRAQRFCLEPENLPCCHEDEGDADEEQAAHSSATPVLGAPSRVDDIVPHRIQAFRPSAEALRCEVDHMHLRALRVLLAPPPAIARETDDRLSEGASITSTIDAAPSLQGWGGGRRNAPFQAEYVPEPADGLTVISRGPVADPSCVPDADHVCLAPYHGDRNGFASHTIRSEPLTHSSLFRIWVASVIIGHDIKRSDHDQN